MDIYKEWQKLNREKFQSSTIKKEEIMQAISKESTLTLSELKKRLRYKINWVLFFIAGFAAWFLFSLKHPQTLPFIAALFVMYAAGGAMLWKNYRQMHDRIYPGKDTLTTMKTNAGLMKKALRAEKIFGLFALPSAIISGIVVPKLYTGMSIPEALSDTRTVVILLGCIVVLGPLMSLLSDKMNKIAYGDYLKKLDENIARMEQLV